MVSELRRKSQDSGSVIDLIYKGYWWQNRGILSNCYPPPTLAIDASHELTGILILNIYLLIPIMTSVVNGIDSSNLNGLSPSHSKSVHVLSSRFTGLQVLPEWQNYFNHPQGWILGKK